MTWNPEPEPWLAVLGAGLVVPGARDGADLARLLAGTAAPATEARWFDAPHTDLAPVEMPVAVCGDEPEGLPRTGGLPRESVLALRAAAAALPASAGTGTVWASSTAGLAEYGQLCVEAATLAPGLASPLLGPQAAVNGPASAVSMRYRLTGPQITLTGGADAGAGGLIEAGRLLAAGECAEVLVGASAALSRWRFAAAGRPTASPGGVPAEGAVCLRLAVPPGPTLPGRSCPDVAPVAALRPLVRGRAAAPVDETALSRFVKECVARLSAPPGAVVLSAPGPLGAAAHAALRAGAGDCRHVERLVGDLGAAGGLLAAAAAVAVVVACPPAGPRTALVVALGAAGDAVAAEVAPCLPTPRDLECPTWN